MSRISSKSLFLPDAVDTLPDWAAPVWWDSVAARTDLSAAARPGGGGGSGGYVPPTFYVAGGDLETAYNIQINFVGTGWTAARVAAVSAAADKLSSIIIGDVSDVLYNGVPIDDIAINVSIGRIDGTGTGSSNVLSQAAVLSYRDATDVGVATNELFMPVTASIKLDTSDLKLSGTDLSAWSGVLLHEMIHTVGLHVQIIDFKGLLDAETGWGPVFLGGHAASAYLGGSLFDTADPRSLLFDGVPVQPLDGSHWDEVNFQPLVPNDLLPNMGVTMGQEVMTAAQTTLAEPMWLSDVTVGALMDLGYTVIDPSVGTGGLRVV